MMAQTIHAAGESSTGEIPKGTYAIALAARDELHLHRIEKKLIAKDIPHVAIREPDPPWNGALMAIGLVPGPRDVIGKEVARLPLIR
jgi:hypothetical protein